MLTLIFRHYFLSFYLKENNDVEKFGTMSVARVPVYARTVFRMYGNGATFCNLEKLSILNNK